MGDIGWALGKYMQHAFSAPVSGLVVLGGCCFGFKGGGILRGNALREGINIGLQQRYLGGLCGGITLQCQHLPVHK